MKAHLALIGFGEAARAFSGAGVWGGFARAYDIRPLERVYSKCGITGCASLAEAVAGAGVIISLVTADQSLLAARGVAESLVDEPLFLDMNSVAPESKRSACEAIAAAGGRYVDAAIMAPVYPAQLSVPVLLSGPDAAEGKAVLEKLGFSDVQVVGSEIGRASTIKMLRSVFYKGMEALTAECLIACARAGVEDDVVASFGVGWSEQANYRLDRMLVHGTRRAAEMREAAKTLRSLGVEPLLTTGTIKRQEALGALDCDPVPPGFTDKLEFIKL